MVPPQIHVQFYQGQIKAQESERLKYFMAPVNELLAHGQAFVGKVWGVQEPTGAVILRFRADRPIPRLKTHYLLTFPTHFMPAQIQDWQMRYHDYRSNDKPLFCRSIKTTIIPTFFLKQQDPMWLFIGVTGFDTEVLEKIREEYLDKGGHPVFLLAENDPPVEYLVNLKKFVSQTPDHTFFSQSVTRADADKAPVNLDNAQNVLPEILNGIQQNDMVLIQGPPGTGKSYLAAEVCAHYMSQGKSVLLSALTNKALMEVAEKKPLEAWVKKESIYKTNLSKDEASKLRGIQRFASLPLPKGSMLLATYYALSKICMQVVHPAPMVDLLIVEEASQAFLATIAMFSALARKVVIVGDHKQLPPIVLEEEGVKALHPRIDSVVRGLEHMIGTEGSVFFRLTKTRRLSPASARLTGVFYDNKLQSIAGPPVRYAGKYAQLFHPEGGVTRVVLPLTASFSGVYGLVSEVVKDLLNSKPELEIAVLSPLIQVEVSMLKAIAGPGGSSGRLTVSTIHRIQGLTVDYAIVLFPLQNPSFELSEYLFNVATSRALGGTLIVAGGAVTLLPSLSKGVRHFFDEGMDVTSHFQRFISS